MTSINDPLSESTVEEQPISAPQEVAKKLKARWIMAPEYRGDSAEVERHSTWLESFFDLSFASAISILAFTFSTRLNWIGALQFILVLVPILWCWIGETFYSARFDTDDVMQRLLVFFEIVAVSGMTLYASSAFTFSSTAAGFALSYVGFRLILIFKYYAAGYFVHKATSLVNRYAGGFLISAILWTISIFLPEYLRPVVRIIAMVIDIATPNLYTKLSAKLPPHPVHIPERFGLFFLVLLGEMTALAINASLSMASSEIRTLNIVIMIWIIFTIWWDYFESASGAGERGMATRKQAKAFLLWMYTHVPLAISVVAMSAVFYQIEKSPTNKPIGEMTGLFLGSAAAIEACTMILIWYSGPSIFRSAWSLKITISYWLIVVVTFGYGLICGVLNPTQALGGLAVLVTIRMGLEIYHGSLSPRDIVIATKRD